MPGTRQVNDAHETLPDLAVVEVASADDETAFAVQEVFAARCAMAPTGPRTIPWTLTSTTYG